jgi:hypothetical protein
LVRDKKYNFLLSTLSGSIPKQMKHFISTPNITLKRKLKEKFDVYNLDEYRTSCLNYKTEEQTDNLYRLDKKKNKHKIHAVLTYQMFNRRKGCINRDRNSVLNMKKLVDHYLAKKERLPNFARGNLDKPTKTCNLCKKTSNTSKPKQIFYQTNI